MSDEPVVTRCEDPEAVAERVAEVMAAAIDGARTIHGAAHVALSGGSLSRAYELVGPEAARVARRAPVVRRRALRAARRRGVQPPPRHRPSAGPRRDVAPGADAPRLRRGRHRLRRGDRRRHARRRGQRHGARRAHRVALPRLPPGPRRRRVRRRPRLAQAAARPRDADLPQAQRLAPDPARRHAARRRRRCSRGSSRGPTPRCPPRCWTARAWRSSPTPRRSMADEVWLLRHAETEWSRTGSTPGARTSRSPTPGARRPAGWASASPARTSPSCSAPRSRGRGRRRSSRASSARGCATTCSSGTTASTRG